VNHCRLRWSCTSVVIYRPTIRIRYDDAIRPNTNRLFGPLFGTKANTNRIFGTCTSLLRTQHDGSTAKGTPPPQILAGIGMGGVAKIVDFRHLSRRVSDTVQDRVQVAIDH